MEEINKQNAAAWKADILSASQNKPYGKSLMNLSNNHLMKWIAADQIIYDDLERVGLVNRGFCPITGAKLTNQDYKWQSQGRPVYISKEAYEMDRPKIDHGHIKTIMTVKFIITVVSALLVYLIIKPGTLWQYVLALGSFVFLRMILIFLLQPWLYNPVKRIIGGKN